MKHLSELGVHCTLCKTKPAFDIVQDDRSRGGHERARQLMDLRLGHNQRGNAAGAAHARSCGEIPRFVDEDSHVSTSV
jgi:hypothetical protein